MRHPILSEAVPHLLPPLLSAFADPLPFAQACAAHSLSHLTTHATAASLYWQRDILEHAVLRSMSGCEDDIWPAVLQCALDLGRCLDAVDGGAVRQTVALRAALIEAKRGGHKTAVRQPFLRCLCGVGSDVHRKALRGEDAPSSGGVVAVVGLQIVSLFGSLLPLVLEWMRLEDVAGVELICQVLPRRSPTHVHALQAL
jgi:hypothetical protein